MTIELKITNNDSRATAIVAVEGHQGETVDTPVELKGGESTTAYVHSGKTIVIREIQHG